MLVGCVLACTSCQVELPIEYETEHLRIGTDLDHPLCHGDLVALERIIARVEDELSIQMSDVATVYLWDYDRWDPESVGCRAYALGCFRPTSMTIWTSDVALEHEIVHAVVGRSSLAPFFDEGLADVYGGAQTRFGTTAPSANEGTSGATTDRGTGSHFVRWLRELWGPAPLGLLVRADEPTSYAFEAIYGMSIEDAEALYFEAAPYGYPSIYACDGPVLTETHGSHGWTGEVALDCGAGTDTRAAALGMRAHRTFHVRDSGYYTVSVDADWFDIFRCSEPRIAERTPHSSFLDDAPVHHATYPSGASRHYFGQGMRDLYLEAGVHDIALGRLGHDQGVARVAIWPALAAQPAPK
jgi:hypothetical protein